MDAPFRLPAIIKHTCNEEYFCAAVSSDGKTIALGTDNYIALFPSLSPTLPSWILDYTAELDSYQMEIQRASCDSQGKCGLCAAFPKLVSEHAKAEKALLHMVFFGREDEYLVALGNGVISLYDLNEPKRGPIINFCFDLGLAIRGKICFTPVNVERYTTVSEIAEKVGLSSFDFIINHRENEINYYKFVFNEEERWWYLDCSAVVNVMAVLDDLSMNTFADELEVDITSYKQGPQHLTAKRFMAKEETNGLQLEESVAGYVTETSTKNGMSKQLNGSCYGVEISKMGKIRKAPTPEEFGRVAGQRSTAYTRTGDANEPSQEVKVSERTNNNEKTHGSKRTLLMATELIMQKMTGNEPTGKAAKRKYAANEVNGLKEKVSQIDYKDFTTLVNADYSKDANGHNAGGKYRQGYDRYKIASTIDRSTPVVEWDKLEPEEWESRTPEKAVPNCRMKPDEPHPFDFDLEEEIWIAEHQDLILPATPVACPVVYCVLTQALSGKGISKKIVSEYQTEDMEHESLSGQFREEATISVIYEREILLAVSYKFGYIGILKLKMEYTILASKKDGDVMYSRCTRPETECLFNFHLNAPINVDNLLYNEKKDGFLAILGGDTTVVLRFSLPEILYNFEDAIREEDTIKIKSYTSKEGFSVSMLFRHQEKTYNSMHRIGCFGFSDDQCVLVTNSNAGLKVFGTKLDTYKRYLRLSVRYENHVKFMDIMWINKTRSSLVLMDDGSYAVLVPMRHQQWFGLVPNFLRISRNMEYIEQEDEFDSKIAPQPHFLSRPIDYDKMEEVSNYKFFHTSAYTLFGNDPSSYGPELECTLSPFIHSIDALEEYSSRLRFEW